MARGCAFFTRLVFDGFFRIEPCKGIVLTLLLENVVCGPTALASPGSWFRNAETQAHVRPPETESALYQGPQKILVCTLKLEKPCSEQSWWKWSRLCFLCPLTGLCWVCKCWWFQSCSEITDWKDVWWEVCCGYILPAECLQEGISVSNFALISNLRTLPCFSSISWVIVFYIWMQKYPLTILREYFVHLFNPTNVQLSSGCIANIWHRVGQDLSAIPWGVLEHPHGQPFFCAVGQVLLFSV